MATNHEIFSLNQFDDYALRKKGEQLMIVFVHPDHFNEYNIDLGKNGGYFT